MKIAITAIHSPEEARRCVDLERQIWGYRDEDLAPASMFVVATHTGGHVYVVFDDGAPVAFALAFSAHDGRRRYWHSHMVGVIPEYQNRGVGRLLKLHQRQEALREGIELIQWTFDPLEPRNAYFNLERLGVVIRKMIPNCYGTIESPLYGGLPTDRFVAEWWVGTPRVEEVVAGHGRALKHMEEVGLPRDIGRIKTSDPGRAREIQAGIRDRCTGLFERGYAITGFMDGPESVRYLLERIEE